MFIIRSRDELKEALHNLLFNLESQKNIYKKKSDLNHLAGQILGVRDALFYIEEWEKQEPSAPKDDTNE